MKKSMLLLIQSLLTIYCLGQKVIPLYNGVMPPGSEIFTLKERARLDSNGEIVTIRNVSMPTLTVFLPENASNNGTAIIICPGGAFQGLAYQQEGTATAKWCVENGITAFILKYRLMPYPYPGKDSIRGAELLSLAAPYIRLATADGREAVKYIRSHASEYGIDPARIGILGYSAGGTVCSSVALTYDHESRPDFVAPIYAAVKAIVSGNVPEDAPPMFLTWATNDLIAKENPSLFEKWREAGKSVEMHSFYSGGHGFSVLKQNKPSDKWTELFMDWMINHGFIKNRKN